MYRSYPGWGKIDINVFAMIQNWIGIKKIDKIELFDKLILIRNFHKYAIKIPSMFIHLPIFKRQFYIYLYCIWLVYE